MKRFGLYAAALAVTMATMLLFKGCGGGERNCTATAECLAGEICVNGKCANCHSATQCEPEYGLGATCESGTCQICPEGSVGCACDGQDTCTSGVCVLGKCVDCWAGTNDCVCREEGEFCDEGLRCNAQGLCEDCPAGELGCYCDTGATCQQGECVRERCTDCQRGTQDCRCYDGGSCDSALRCNTDAVCEICPAGEQACPCRSEGEACQAGLICDAGLCIEDPCPAGTVNCHCGNDDECDADLYCDDADDNNAICKPCSNDIEGCPCDENDSCQNDLVCDTAKGTCRNVLTCDDIECAPHQICQPGATELEDAICLEECDAGWRWNPSDLLCDELTCLPDVSYSISAECANRNRTCVQNPEGGAVCGECLPDFVDEDGTLLVCREVIVCDDLDCESHKRFCTPATTTSDASCGDCLDNFVDEDGTLSTCRAVYTCDDLDCLVQHRECTPATSTSDAICNDCLEAYLEQDRECSEKNCSVTEKGSILEICNVENRKCVTLDLGAECGDCLGGYVQDPDGDCQEEKSCEVCDSLNRECVMTGPYCGDCKPGTFEDPQGQRRCIVITCADVSCDADQFCIEGSQEEPPRCIDSPCNTGQAVGYHTQPPACVDCTVTCNGEGETGRIWPFALDQSDRCICETDSGYYWNEGINRGARPCDADDDGWIRGPARHAVRSSDPALAENARCALRSIDRFVLENELGQRLPVFLCQGDPLYATDPADCPGGLLSLDLYETTRNDDQSILDSESAAAPPYSANMDGSGTGRPLRAEEINSLTRACVSQGADYNDNQLADIGEWHGMPNGSLQAEEKVYAEFSYLIELHRGFYEPGSLWASFGQYVIQERNRCELDAFFLNYGEEPDGHDYWRECTRSRDASFSGSGNPAQPDFGLDFARWSCKDESGGCPIPPPPTDSTPLGDQIPIHGMCQVPIPPIDAECDQADSPWLCVDGGVWRGMSHHSQFRCVVASDEPPADPPLEPRVPLSRFSNTGDYLLNRCYLDCPEGDQTCASDCEGSGCNQSSRHVLERPNPSQAQFVCQVDTNPPSAGTVGIAAVNFIGPGEYQRGCIDEWTPTAPGPDAANNPEIAGWRGLCPGWTRDPAGTIGKGTLTNFGRLQCGCIENYGGLDCNIGCPDHQLHVQYFDGEYKSSPREGFWMCADFAATAYTTNHETYGPALVGQTSSDGVYVLRGEVPVSPTDRAPLCENEDCATGFALR